jgi:NAD+ kinase
LVANPGKPAVRQIALQAVEMLAAAGCAIWSDPATAALFETSPGAVLPAPRLAKAVDLLLVFGGDGTMLRVTREMEGSRTPILGINAGRLGFLTAISSKELAPALGKVLAGQISVESRPLLVAEGNAQGRPICFHGLNDAVISRGSASRMIELEVSVDGAYLTSYRCDGLIIASPTGSTAYSLSAGGAIISPTSEVFALTPICPHTLSNRPIVLDMRSRIEVRVASGKVETAVTVDGQVDAALSTGDVVSIRRSRREVRLVHLEGNSFFETLRRKLHWSGSNV